MRGYREVGEEEEKATLIFTMEKVQRGEEARIRLKYLEQP